jgi:hypothetical protein
MQNGKFLPYKVSVTFSFLLGFNFILVPVTAIIADRFLRCDTCKNLIETLRSADVDLGGVAETILKFASLHWFFYAVFGGVMAILMYRLPRNLVIQKTTLIVVSLNILIELYFLLKLYTIIDPWSIASYWIRKI